MQSKRIFLILGFAAVVAFVLPLSAMAADAYPNGCVSCHVGDKVLSKLLVTMTITGGKKHADISKIVKSVPDGCLMCHKATGKIPSLVKVVHKVHSVAPPATVTAASYTGACLTCHAVDAKGVVAIKKGKPNW